MALRSFKSIVDAAKSTDSYWGEKAKLDVAIGINNLMNRNSITNTALAEKLGVKPPYVTKVLKGDSNLTIESLVKIARAVGGKLDIHLSDRNCNVRWYEVFDRVDFSERSDKVKSLFANSRGAVTKDISFANAPSAANGYYEAESLSA